jgi:hypothetical protein
MLTSEKIRNLFAELNDELAKNHETGEIGIVGGAVMCLVFNARASTRDVDAIFKPAQLVRRLAAKIGEKNNLPIDWLNDAAKAYLQEHFERQEVLNLSHLRVWAPHAKYMLAMKCISARWDTNDRDDVIFLIRFLKLVDASSVFAIIESYYPKKQIPSKTQFFIEEVLQEQEL